MLFIVVSSVGTPTQLILPTVVTDVDLPTYRNSYQPFVIYADFESSLKPDDKVVDTTQGVEIGGESSSHVFQEHIPCSFAHKVVSSVDPNFSRPLVKYRGEDAAEKFVRDLQQEAKQLFDEYIATPKPMLLTATELRLFYNATTCHICTNRLEMIKYEIIGIL